MVMESNEFTLSEPLRKRIQGSIGELVGLEYICNNLKKEHGDVIIIVKNRYTTIQDIVNNLNPNKDYVYVDKTPFDFLRHDLVKEFHTLGCEAIDFTNADIEAKNLFDKYRSKTKKQILSELEGLYMGYRKEIEKDREESEKMRAEREKARDEEVKVREEREKEAREESERRIKTLISDIVTLPHEDLAKVLTLIELEKCLYFEKERDLSVRKFKIRSLYTFKQFFLSDIEWSVRDYEKRRNTINIISENANDMFEKWNLFTSVFNCLNLTKNRPDAMIVHYHREKLKKLILIECKSGNAVLSPNQNDCIDCIKKIKTDKVGYKKINVDYQLPEKLTVSEISYIP